MQCRYAAAVYWAAMTMSTTGYGDILPRTNWERSYALCVMLVGVVLSALVFGVLAQIITEAFDHLPTGNQHHSEVLPLHAWPPPRAHSQPHMRASVYAWHTGSRLRTSPCEKACASASCRRHKQHLLPEVQAALAHERTSQHSTAACRRNADCASRHLAAACRYGASCRRSSLTCGLMPASHGACRRRCSCASICTAA
jgi:hypothetical protein